MNNHLIIMRCVQLLPVAAIAVITELESINIINKAEVIEKGEKRKHSVSGG